MATAYISTGETTAMFTLRVIVENDDRVEDIYVKNLSNDKAIALRKLEDYCEETGCYNGGIAEVNLRAITRRSSTHRTAEQIEREAREAEQRSIEEALERKERTAKIIAENVAAIGGELIFNRLKEAANGNNFLTDILSKIDKKEFSENQVAALKNAYALIIEDEAGQDAPEGKQEIKGEVKTLKVVEGYYGTQLKMLVRDQRGFKVWSTVPAAIADEVETGNTITFTATLEVKATDKKFAYAKRPTKAAILAA